MFKAYGFASWSFKSGLLNANISSPTPIDVFVRKEIYLMSKNFPMYG